MAGRPFQRLSSNEQLYHSPSPSQEFDIGSYPFNGQSRGRSSLTPNNDYATYMNSYQQQQQQQQQQHPGPGFRSPFGPTNTAYQPVGQHPEGEKKPGFQRTHTDRSNRSRLSSVSSTTSKILTPLMTRPWHHKRDNNGELGTVRVFSRSRQARKTLVHGLIQWIPPALFSACMALVLYLYDRESTISHKEKYVFNALLLGFTLLLGFSVQSSFKLYADLMRWRFLASSHWDLKTFERIMGSSSQRTVLKLLWNGRRRHSCLPSRVQIVSFIYLFVAVGLQVVIACLGLCYSVETSQTAYAWAWGNTTISDLSTIRLVAPIDGLTDFEDFVVQSGAANTYGLTSTQFTVYQNPTPDMYNYGATIYTNSDQSKYWYKFLSYCSDPNCNVWQSTSRSVNASASCRQYEITNDGGWLDRSNVSWVGDDGYETWFDFGNIPVSGTTTFAADMNETCGPRCSTIMSINTGPDSNSTARDIPEYQPQFFICNNTVTDVEHIARQVNQSEYSLPDKQARIFAGSIGFAGNYWDGLDYQLRNYAYRSYWSWDFEPRSETEVARLVSQYSIGAIAALDQSGPRIYTFGEFPKRALGVTVKWMFTILVLASVPGVQLLFLFFVIWFTRNVVIRDGSFLGNARLLRPIANELGDKGCALDGDDIAEALESVRIAYGVRLPAREVVHTGYNHGQNGGPLMHLDIIQEGEANTTGRMDAWQPGMSMPEGRYDGYEAEHVFNSRTSSVDEKIPEGLKPRRGRRLSL